MANFSGKPCVNYGLGSYCYVTVTTDTAGAFANLQSVGPVNDQNYPLNLAWDVDSYSVTQDTRGLVVRLYGRGWHDVAASPVPKDVLPLDTGNLSVTLNFPSGPPVVISTPVCYVDD